MDLSTGEKKVENLGTKSKDEALKYLAKKRRELEEELLSPHYDSNEKRIRRYIDVRKEISNEAMKNIGRTLSDGEKRIDSRTEAMSVAQIGDTTARKGEIVVNYIDELISSNRNSEAKELRILLNRSVSEAEKIVRGKGSFDKERSIETLISSYIPRLARAVDERKEIKGGDGFRNDCISILKQLSTKINEWRASE